VAEGNDLFGESWRYRDTILYPDRLGNSSDPSISTIPYIAFAQMGVEQVDPRWLHCGVLSFPPTAERLSFTFVTSGLSNAWDDGRSSPASISGLGIELCIDDRCDEHWPKDVLLRLSTMQLLIGAGRFTGARLLRHGDYIKIGAETFGEGSAMTTLLTTKVADLQLPSGTFEMMQLFAITDAERELGVRQGADALVVALRQYTTYPINDIMRSSVV
jgi:hypothetical protein